MIHSFYFGFTVYRMKVFYSIGKTLKRHLFNWMKEKVGFPSRFRKEMKG